MALDSKNDEISPFTVAVYAFLKAHIDGIEIDKFSGSEFSTLLDLKKAVDAVVTQGADKFREIHGGPTK